MAFLIALVATALSTLVMILWNWLIPLVFDGPTISWGQALGLLVLTKLLFGGWNRWGRGEKDYCRNSRGRWKKKFEQKWNSMTPEEQERFKQNFTRHCHRWRWSEPAKETESTSDKVKAGS